MMKKAILMLVVVVMAMAFQDVKTGSYQTIDVNNPEKLTAILADPEFIKAQEKARNAYEAEHNGSLGEIKKIQTQVVAGVNYKMTFDSAEGPVEIVVWVQPWSDTVKVTSIRTSIEENNLE